DAGRKIQPGQTLVLADAAQAKIEGGLTVILHKPVGVVSAQPDPGQVPAIRLLTRAALEGDSPMIPGRDTRLAPVGRLDMDSRGLLLLSDDGVVAKAVIGPTSELDKECVVKVAGQITEAKLAKLRHGLSLDGRQLRPAQVRVSGEQTLRFILKEGRNRQIRRMCDLVELKVVDLFRLRIGPLKLGDLRQGRWRVLTAEERAALIKAGGAGR
ncbi:MAG TPA: pseudouridine synthase, partial [Phenylobacterium sp.]|nr:pseudouridine synthase [Phenylobacterium sp.]